jgi:hypothetical protein
LKIPPKNEKRKRKRLWLRLLGLQIFTVPFLALRAQTDDRSEPSSHRPWGNVFFSKSMSDFISFISDVH